MRRDGWRLAAVLLGALMLPAHVYTFPTPQPVHELLAPTYRDIVYHGGMALAFALAYRLSFTPRIRGRGGGPLARRYLPELAVLVVCGTWGALCELAQVPLHPAREFHWVELGLNTGAPALVAGVSALLAARRFD